MKQQTINFTKKHKYLIITLTIIIILILWILWGNYSIQTTHFTVQDEELPESFNGYKIAQVSDLHNKDWGSQLIEKLQEEEPDIIVLTGDLIDSSKTDLPTALEFIDQSKEIAPLYFVTGNHEAWSEEYVQLKAELVEREITILDNQSIFISKGSSQIMLAGLQDPAFQNSSPEETLKTLSSRFEGFKILLSHRPELYETYAAQDFQLVFSGHAHGGQFGIPFIGGLIAPDQGIFPEYTAGIYTENQTHMIVSRGLGNSIIPVRINNRPELVTVTLKN